MLALLGIEFKESKDQAGTTVEYLGILIRFLPRGAIELSITPKRRLSLMITMQEILDENTLSPADALAIAGKLGFACTTVWGRFGRGMITPFYWRGYAPINNHKLTDKIRQA